MLPIAEYLPQQNPHAFSACLFVAYYKLEDCQFEPYNFYDESGNLINLNTPVEKEIIL
ncbi:hypothetical protein D3C72_2363860 [compost metagenome]